MKIVSLNLGNFSSTGGIMTQLTKMCKKENIQAFCSYPKHTANIPANSDDIVFSTNFFRRASGKLASYSGFNGCFSFFSTLSFLRKIRKLEPDLIHFHNLHNSYINLPMLFKYIKKHKFRIIWTLHDCWAFTGHCPHFDMIGCSKWKNGCHSCPQYRGYPKSLYDNSQKMYMLKKKWFTGVEDLTVVTPSQWLSELVKQSFLKEYPVKVIRNGIDLSVFKPTKSDFRKKYACENKFILLGVAFDWGERKGLDVFVELSKRLDEQFKIVLVGTNESIDATLPDNIVSIHRTENQKQLAEIYTAADLFVNPTREENYPTVNMEALACGTPVITFNTGGSPESPDETCGSVVPRDDIEALCNEIIRVHNERPFSTEACLKRAKLFDKEKAFEEYIQLYKMSEKRE